MPEEHRQAGADDQQQTAQPHDSGARVAFDQQAGELLLTLEGVGQAIDLDRPRLVEHCRAHRRVLAGRIDLDPHLTRFDTGSGAPGGRTDHEELLVASGHLEHAVAERSVRSRPLQRHPIIEEQPAGGVPDLHDRSDAEIGLMEHHAVVPQRIIDPNILPSDLAAVDRQHQIGDVILGAAIVVVGVGERDGLSDQSGAVAHLGGPADGQRELVIAESGQRADHEPRHDHHERGMRDHRPERGQMPLVSVEIGPRPVVILDHPHAPGLRVLLDQRHGLTARQRRGEPVVEPSPAKELRGHLGVRVESSLHQHRNSMGGAGSDAQRQQPHDGQEQRRAENVEQADGVHDRRPAAVAGPHRLQPAVHRGRVAANAGRHLGEKHPEQAGQPGGQDERQPDLLVVEERVDRPQRLGRRETGSTVEPIDGFIDAHWTTAVSRLDTHG